MVKMPKKSRLFFFAEMPNEWVLLQIFYSQPLKLRPYIDGAFDPQWERDAIPDRTDIHGAHAQNPQERRLYILLRGDEGVDLVQKRFQFRAREP